MQNPSGDTLSSPSYKPPIDVHKPSEQQKPLLSEPRHQSSPEKPLLSFLPAGKPRSVAEHLVAALAGALLIAICITSLGLIIGANMKSPEGFNLVMSFVMWPMFMLSGALFPIDNIPSYLSFLIQLNPLTYGVDLMRFVILGSTSFGPLADIAALLFATLIFVIIGTKSFEKMQV